MKPRAHIYVPRPLLPALAVIIVIGVLNHQVLLLTAGAGALIAFTAMTWLLSPYWPWAMRVRLPPDEAYERWHRRAVRMRSLPVIGRMTRRGERQLGVSGETLRFAPRSNFGTLLAARGASPRRIAVGLSLPCLDGVAVESYERTDHDNRDGVFGDEASNLKR